MSPASEDEEDAYGRKEGVQICTVCLPRRNGGGRVNKKECIVSGFSHPTVGAGEWFVLSGGM